jgi:glycosyltransferase involved in cell wall biosynthesis
MTIALVLYGRLGTLTGGFLYDRYLVEALQRRGHRVEVVGLPWRHYGACLLDNFSHELCDRLCRGSWDLILQDELVHPSLFRLNRRIRRRSSTPIVSIIHQVLCRQPRCRWFNLAYRQVERAYLQTADAYIFNSTATRDQVRQLVGETRPHCVARPAGSRLGTLYSQGHIAEKNRQSGPLELLFVGHLSPVKGLHALLAGLARLPQDMWRLTLVGDMAADRRCVRRARAIIARHGLGKQVVFRGCLDGDDLKAVYSRSHAFAMPFAHEGFGIAALEAMGFGLPVIGSSAGGVREFVRHGENGFLVAPGDHESVGRHIEALHRDRGRLIAMGTAAFNTGCAWPSWQQALEPACVFLEKLMAL